MKLLSEYSLERSGVVANCRMNRERSLTGSNGYSKELGINPLDFLRERAKGHPRICWLDLCCGSGEALIEAAEAIHREGWSGRVEIVGVDLVGGWLGAEPSCLHFVETSLTTWKPDRRFDLITCVHGLHYIGDKLGLIARAASWLTDVSRFVANLDLNNIRLQDCVSSSRTMPTIFHQQGFEINSRRKLIGCFGHKRVTWPLRYLGADDDAGPNYTGQPAVNSHYMRVVHEA